MQCGPCVCDCTLGIQYGAASIFHKVSPSIGQLNCLMVPHKEAQVSLLFEHGNLLAQRRLVDAQSRGCTRKVKFFG
jgi:hypothetical protein